MKTTTLLPKQAAISRRVMALLAFGTLLGFGVSLFSFSALGAYFFYFNEVDRQFVSVATYIWRYDLLSITIVPTHLPTAFMLSGLLGALICSLFAYLHSLVAFARLAIGFLAAFAAATFWIGTHLHQEVCLYVAFLLVWPMGLVLSNIFWGMFSRLFDVSQIRRLTVGIVLGFTFTQATGYAVAAWLMRGRPEAVIELIGECLIYSGVALLLAAVLLFVYQYRRKALRNLAENRVHIHANNSLRPVLRDPYRRLLAWFSLVSGMGMTLVAYQFFTWMRSDLFIIQDSNALFSLHFAQFPELLAFLGGFSALLYIAITLFRQFAQPKVLAVFGLKRALLILPLVMGFFLVLQILFQWLAAQTSLKEAVFAMSLAVESSGVFLWVVNLFSSKPIVAASESILQGTYFEVIFIFVTGTKFLADLLQEALESPTYKYYFLPIETALRNDLQVKIEGVLRIVAVFFVGLLLAANEWLGIHIPVAYLTLGVVAVWVVVALELYARYREKLENKLKSAELAQQEDGGNSPEILLERQLAQEAATLSKEHALRALNLLGILHPEGLHRATIGLVSTPNDRVQEVALWLAEAQKLIPAIKPLEEFQDSKFYLMSGNVAQIKAVLYLLKGAQFRLERLKYIEQLTYSKSEEERLFGALLTRYFPDPKARTRLVKRLLLDESLVVQRAAIGSAIRLEDPELVRHLINRLGDIRFANTALSTLAATGNALLDQLEDAFAFTGQSVAVQLRILQLYGKIGKVEAAPLLAQQLSHPNQALALRAIQELGQLQHALPTEWMPLVRGKLEETMQGLAWKMNTYQQLRQLRGDVYLQKALLSEIRDNYGLLFSLLGLLYGTQSVSLIRRNLEQVLLNGLTASVADQQSQLYEAEFALELLEVFTEETIKVRLKPLLMLSQIDEKLAVLSEHYYLETATDAASVYRSLIGQDINRVNRWTRATALHAYLQTQDAKLAETLSIHAFNADPLLQEMALLALQERTPEALNSILARAGVSPYVGSLKQRQAEAFPKFELVLFLEKIELFKQLPGFLLAEIAAWASVRKVAAHTELYAGSLTDLPVYFLVNKGQISVALNSQTRGHYTEGDLIHLLDQHPMDAQHLRIATDTDCLLMTLPMDRMHELMSLHPAIARCFIFQTHSKNPLGPPLAGEGRNPLDPPLTGEGRNPLGPPLTGEGRISTPSTLSTSSTKL